MSPLAVRRYRAERLLRDEFQRLRGAVLATVRARLRAAGVSLDPCDLEACYAQAWHGLYMTMLEGQGEIDNPAGWLALVTYRRAIDEHRTRTRACRAGEQAGDDASSGPDLADALDDRERLRQLMEGLRGRLGPRERQAAALCYLQGLSRADAAARMGISEKRMRKLMDGSRAGRPGVAATVNQLLETIRAGSFCAEQSSLMRGLAFGVLDPGGERYALAQAHRRECPACRAYVLSLRGLASVLPPPALPLALGAGAAAGAGTTAAGGGAGAGAGAATGAAGAGGGGWLLAGGGLGAKLAAGCLLAVGVGASCLALTAAPRVRAHDVRHRRVARALRAPAGAPQEAPVAPVAGAAAAGARATVTAVAGAAPQPAPSRVSPALPAGVPPALPPAGKASREFGLEQALSAGPQAPAKRMRARIAHARPSARSSAGSAEGEASGGGGVGGSGSGSAGSGSAGVASEASATAPASSSTPAPGASSSSGGGSSSSAAPSSPSHAQREFGIG